MLRTRPYTCQYLKTGCIGEGVGIKSPQVIPLSPKVSKVCLCKPLTRIFQNQAIDIFVLLVTCSWLVGLWLLLGSSSCTWLRAHLPSGAHWRLSQSPHTRSESHSSQLLAICSQNTLSLRELLWLEGRCPSKAPCACLGSHRSDTSGIALLCSQAPPSVIPYLYQEYSVFISD